MSYDRLTIYLSVTFTVIILSILAYFFISSGGSYFPAWLTILCFSIALLSILSIPKYVIISPQAVEIHSVLELTHVKFSDIKRVKIIEKKDMKWCIPFFGIMGLCGYFGYYINLRRMQSFKLYARRWSNFIMIEDRFNNKLIFSIDNPEDFVEQIAKKI